MSNVWVVLPDAIVTLAGTIAPSLLLASVTTAPSAGAAAVSTTVAVTVSPPVTLLAVTVTPPKAAAVVVDGEVGDDRQAPSPISEASTRIRAIPSVCRARLGICNGRPGVQIRGHGRARTLPHGCHNCDALGPQSVTNARSCATFSRSRSAFTWSCCGRP